ncbi:hypothetical protein [Phaeospirillum tilakii]|uniref:Uncharacterized protein n=1 Tax=Phaeospirillum tilakii TaxID=741673 RepID=A0ABW5CAG6_9PROT
MNRCAEVLATACTSKLASLIRVAGGIEFDKLTFNSSLKYAILNDPSLVVRISASSSFEVFELAGGIVRNDSPALAAARVSDFFMGAQRVKCQYDTLVNMKNSSPSTAWLLVTAYYCAFFACIELNKINDKSSTSFTKRELDMLAAKAAGDHYSAFFGAGHTNFVGRIHAGKLVFEAVGTRPHVAAWQNALYVIRNIFNGYDWVDAKYYISVMEKEIYSPSAIRNEWNYKRVDYYGPIGETRASDFKKLVGNPKAAHLFLCQRRGLLCDLDPCVIAVLCETLAGAIGQASQRSKQILKSLASN